MRAAAQILAFALLLAATPMAQANALAIFMATAPANDAQAPATDACAAPGATIERDAIVGALALGLATSGGALDALACSARAAATPPPSASDRIKRLVDNGLLDSYYLAQPHGSGHLNSEEDLQAARAMSKGIFDQVTPDRANAFEAMIAGGPQAK